MASTEVILCQHLIASVRLNEELLNRSPLTSKHLLRAENQALLIRQLPMQSKQSPNINSMSCHVCSDKLYLFCNGMLTLFQHFTSKIIEYDTFNYCIMTYYISLHLKKKSKQTCFSVVNFHTKKYIVH